MTSVPQGALVKSFFYAYYYYYDDYYYYFCLLGFPGVLLVGVPTLGSGVARASLGDDPFGPSRHPIPDASRAASEVSSCADADIGYWVMSTPGEVVGTLVAPNPQLTTILERATDARLLCAHPNEHLSHSGQRITEVLPERCDTTQTGE